MQMGEPLTPSLAPGAKMAFGRKGGFARLYIAGDAMHQPFSARMKNGEVPQ
jgi:hypothetical protein